MPEPDSHLRLTYSGSTYHRRAVNRLAHQHAHLVRGLVLHVGGPNDYWLVRGAARAVSVDVVPGPGVDVIADGMALPFSPSRFDAVVAIEMLESVRRPEVMTGELHRVLKTGGAAVLSVPFVWRVAPTPTDYWRFTGEGLASLLERFTSREVIPVTGARETLLHVLYQYLEVALHLFGLPRALLNALKPIEALVFLIIPRETSDERLWATGWLAVARK